MPADSERLLAIYLNDHLAGSTGGLNLARRLRDSNAAEPEFGPPLEALAREIEADREALLGLMEKLGVRRDPLKPAGAWLAEKLGRLKLNGRIRGYSPLSRVLELEMLAAGVAGKKRLWAALEGTLGSQSGEFDSTALADRAADQLARLEELHQKAAARAFPAERTSPADEPPAG